MKGRPFGPVRLSPCPCAMAGSIPGPAVAHGSAGHPCTIRGRSGRRDFRRGPRVGGASTGPRLVAQGSKSAAFPIYLLLSFEAEPMEQVRGYTCNGLPAPVSRLREKQHARRSEQDDRFLRLSEEKAGEGSLGGLPSPILRVSRTVGVERRSVPAPIAGENAGFHRNAWNRSGGIGRFRHIICGLFVSCYLQLRLPNPPTAHPARGEST